MKKSKATQKALLVSIVSLLLSCLLLIGSTFAWFTDSVTLPKNRLASGYLDIELYHGAALDEKVDENTSLFSDSMWEPGHVEIVKLKVCNKGTLALKYQFGINIAEEQNSVNVDDKSFRLSDYIEFAVLKDPKDFSDDDEGRKAAVSAAKEAGTVKISELAKQESQKGILYPVDNESNSEHPSEQLVTLVLFMPETADINSNYKLGEATPEISLGITLIATQVPFEKDSFGNDYDSNVKLTEN